MAMQITLALKGNVSPNGDEPTDPDKLTLSIAVVNILH